MKINHEYLKGLLIALEGAEKPTTDIKELGEAGFPHQSDDFIFHMRLLQDRGLMERADNHIGFGYTQTRGAYTWVVAPLRLTAEGHDFIEDLKKKEVWEAVKSNFKEEGLSSLVTVTRSLAEGFAKKKIRDITGIDL